MTFAPPPHLSPAAAAYLRQPDVLDYPDWSDETAVAAFREVAHPLWASMNEGITVDYTVVEDDIAGVPVTRITSGAPRTNTVVVHLHGGMYCVGNPEIDHCINAPLAHLTGAEVVSVDYRLAPGHPFPAALDDAVAVHRALADSGATTVLYGESAGGGLALATCLALRDGGAQIPKRLALLSPMLDLTGGSDTYRTLASVDPDYGDTSALLEPARAYAAATPLDHPMISPLFAPLHDLPPTLVQVGGREVLLGDSARFAQKARRAGTSVELHVLDGGWHNYPIWAGVPEAAAAQQDLAMFLMPMFLMPVFLMAGEAS